MKSFKTAWNHIRRSPYQALAAIMIMMLTFLAISLFTILTIGAAKVISYFESRPQVTVFFKDDTQAQEISNLTSELKQNQKINTIKYISKQDALKIYQEQNKNDPLLLDLVTSDILPASLEISTYQIQDLNEVSEVLQKSEHISEVVYQKDVVQNLTRWTQALRIIGLLIITILSVVSVFIMATIIGFKISQKREEIEIMKLLSATNWYIRWPFVLEGVFYGIVGAVTGWLIASIGLIWATPNLQSFLGTIPLLPAPPVFFLGLLGMELLIAVILGFISSILAVFRYLK